MRTTLDLPDPLFKEVKMRAVEQGLKLKDLLAAYIEAGLRNPQLLAKEGIKNPHALPIGWEADGSVTPSRTNAELEVLLEEEEP